MTIEELRKQLDQFKVQLQQGAGHMATTKQDGPVTMFVVDAIFDTLQTLDQRIAALERSGSSPIQPFIDQGRTLKP